MSKEIMKVVSLDKDSEETLTHNIKNLQDFVDAYKKGGCRGFVAFRIDKSSKKLDHLFGWDEGHGMSILGGLDMVRCAMIKHILGVENE